jgi:hypothetical protein
MFPFLDNAHKSFLSCRDFVRDVLPRYQSHSPRMLESAQLEHETGNTTSRIVRGDGVEIHTDKPACEEFAGDSSSSSVAQDLAGSMDSTEVGVEELGWQAWTEQARNPSSQPTSPQDRDGTSIDLDTHPEVPVSPPRRTTSYNSLHPLQPLSSLPPQQASPPRRKKRFTVSHASSMSFSPSHTRSVTEQYHASPSHSHWRPLPVFVTNAIAPAPTIRSRDRAISHPDMAQLCREWAQGPANQTTTYRPDNVTP